MQANGDVDEARRDEQVGERERVGLCEAACASVRATTEVGARRAAGTEGHLFACLHIGAKEGGQRDAR